MAKSLGQRYFFLLECPRIKRNNYNWSNLKRSSVFTSRRTDIFMRVSSDGWASFVHHLLTVESATPSSAANHLFDLPLSTKTTFIRFIFFLDMYFDFFGAKVLKKKKKYRNADVIIRVYGYFFVILCAFR